MTLINVRNSPAMTFRSSHQRCSMKKGVLRPATFLWILWTTASLDDLFWILKPVVLYSLQSRPLFILKRFQKCHWILFAILLWQVAWPLKSFELESDYWTNLFFSSKWVISFIWFQRSIEKRQKQPSRGVLKKRCTENIRQIYRRTPVPKCDFNKVAK